MVKKIEISWQSNDQNNCQLSLSQEEHLFRINSKIQIESPVEILAEIFLRLLRIGGKKSRNRR